MMRTNRPSGVVRSDAEPAAPGTASAARAGVRFSVAGRSDVPQGRVGPALLRMAPTMQLPCRRLRRPAARRSRRWPLASCSAPMASRLRCLSRTAGDASLASATASAATTASASIKGFRFTPSCPARSPMVSRSRRLPHVRMAPPAGFVAAARIPRPAPARPSIGRHGSVRAHGAHPPLRSAKLGASAAQLAPGHRHPRAVATAPLPDFRRLSGLPVWSEWLPTHRRSAAPEWRSIYVRHQGGTRKKLLAGLAPLAARPL